MLHLRNIVRMVLLLGVVFGLPVLAAVLARQVGWSPQLVGWLTLLLLVVLAWLGSTMERRGGPLGTLVRKARKTLFPNSELPPKGSGRKSERD